MKRTLYLLSAILTLTLVAGCANTEKINNQVTTTTDSGVITTSQESTIPTISESLTTTTSEKTTLTTTTTIATTKKRTSNSTETTSLTQSTSRSKRTTSSKITSSQTTVSTTKREEKNTKINKTTKSTSTESKLITTTSERTTTAKSTTRKRTSEFISKDQAKTFALRKANVDAQKISRFTIELDYNDDAWRWEYEIGFYVQNTEYDITIDAKTGKILKFEKEIEKEKQTSITTASSTTVADTKISGTEAKQIALDRAGVTETEVREYEVELDYDDDARRWEYEISFRVGRIEYDLTIDAKTGNVLEFEKDID